MGAAYDSDSHGNVLVTLPVGSRVTLAHAYETLTPPRDGCRMVMATETKQWTLAEFHRLPDDGNRYELVRGTLFVTPAPA